MKVLVPVKRVVDANVKVRVKADGSGVDLANVKMSINPFDEIAVEEAVRLKEHGAATEVVVVSIGPAAAEEALRAALAIGADRGVLLQHDGELEPLGVAKALQQIAVEEAPRPRDPRQAGDRLRLRPDRADAGRPAGLAAGHLRVEGRDRGRARGRDARSRRGPPDL